MSKRKEEPLYKFLKTSNDDDMAKRMGYKVILIFGTLGSLFFFIIPSTEGLRWALLGMPFLAFINWFLQVPLKMEDYIISSYFNNMILVSFSGIYLLGLTFIVTFPILALNEWLLALTAILFYMSPFFYYGRIDYEKTKEYMIKVHRGEIEPSVYEDEDGNEVIDYYPKKLELQHVPCGKFYIVETPMWITMLFNISIFLMVALSIGVFIANKFNPVQLDTSWAWILILFNSFISMLLILATLLSYREIKPLLHAVRILKDEESKIKGKRQD